MRRITPEEGKNPIPKEWHGRVIKVGRKFVRVVIPGLPHYWKKEYAESSIQDASE